MPDGGYYAIKGFEFQIDKTILEIFNAKDAVPICLEQIQDINSNNFVIQVKYKETQSYTPAKIKEPIIQLLNEYKASPCKRYYLYCYFNNVKEEQREMTSTELDRVLGNNKNDFTVKHKDDFVKNFELHFSKTFQEQFLQAVEAIKENANCAHFDEALIFYGNITNHLRKIIVNNTVIANRTCTKSEIIQLITGNRKIVFDSAYRIYKGKQKYIAEIKKKHFTFGNIDDWARFLVIELIGNESISVIKSTALQIKKKFYKEMKSGIKSGAPYIYFRNISDNNLKKLKHELISEGYTIKDGYDFMDADFNIQSLKEKSTLANKISIKFLNNEDDMIQIINCNLNRTKIIYQFYINESLEIKADIEMVNIEVSNLSEIQQILK